jgi:hypothetical protein
MDLDKKPQPPVHSDHKEPMEMVSVEKETRSNKFEGGGD